MSIYRVLNIATSSSNVFSTKFRRMSMGPFCLDYFVGLGAVLIVVYVHHDE